MKKSRPDVLAGKGPKRTADAAAEAGPNRHGRETIESIAIAVVLAFLFRAFVAEAFVIPTGSMAPTLQGRHMDVACPKCGYRYRTGASVENEGHGEVIRTTCPLCRYRLTLDKRNDPNLESFNGDRILVSKFAYEFSDPQRWDVIVFKFPGNAKQNYIKRLTGLPEETLRISHGDLFYRTDADRAAGRAEFRIARKPPDKLRAMLQLVDDSAYVAPDLTRVGWPPRWQDWRSAAAPSWRQRAGQPGYETTAVSDQEAWLRYRHVVPLPGDWEQIAEGETPEDLRDNKVQGQLITDYYAYNDGMQSPPKFDDPRGLRAFGLHWVGDLALEADVEVGGEQGEVLLDLVRGGVHYTCRMEVATGAARLAIDNGQVAFVGDDGQESRTPSATTALRGPGRYRLRYANCDAQLLLWVNNRLAVFDGPTTYRPDDPAQRTDDVQPRWSEKEPGDLEPLGIGARGVALSVSQLRVFRDVYYVAVSSGLRMDDEYEEYFPEETVIEIMASPQAWATTRLFAARRPFVEFHLGADQFLPLGDNSPQSRDARLWSHPDASTGELNPPPYVRRDLLTGQALLIYWPHAWRRPIPMLPNFRRMGLIR